MENCEPLIQSDQEKIIDYLKAAWDSCLNRSVPNANDFIRFIIAENISVSEALEIVNKGDFWLEHELEPEKVQKILQHGGGGCDIYRSMLDFRKEVRSKLEWSQVRTKAKKLFGDVCKTVFSSQSSNNQNIMRKTPAENREQTLQGLKEFLKEQVRDSHYCLECTSIDAVMGFYKKVDPDEALEFLKDDEAWQILTAELNGITGLPGAVVRKSWVNLRKELTEAFERRKSWQERIITYRKGIKKVFEFLKNTI